MPLNNQQGNRANRHKESGNVFAIVMIGVVLFGALMYTFSRSAKQGDGNLTRKKVEVIASDILAYAQRLERGVARVMTHSCSENFISFETEAVPDYPANADAPTDLSCHVFAPAGGGMSPLQETSFDISGLDIRPSGGSALSGIGTHDPGDPAGHQDLVVWFSGLTLELCQELNRRMNFTAAIPTVADVQAWEFGQELIVDQHFGNTNLDLGALSGSNGGCVNRNGAPSNAFHLAEGYNFYYVLYPR